MNILFICDEYPPGKNGGIGTSVQVLARELVKGGHSVYVAGLYSYNYGQLNYEEDNGVKVWRLRYGWNLHVKQTNILHKIFNKIPDFIKQHLNGRKAFGKYIHFINELIDREKIDIIEVPDWNTFAMQIGFTVKWPAFKVPLVVKSHGSYTKICNDLNIKPKKKLVKIDQLLYDRADALSAVSKDTSIINKRLFNITKPIKVLYNGIKIPNTPKLINEKKQKVIYTGSLIVPKGIHQLIKAWNTVHPIFPNVLLEVYGKGNIKPLKELLSNDALKTVIFKGHINRNELLNILSTATLAVFPSYSETFGLGAVEAMSNGCPVIYTKRSCGPEIVRDKIDGLLIDPDNISEIADCIILLLENEKLRTNFATSGFESTKKRFDIKLIKSLHIEFYNHVIKNFNKNGNITK